MELPLEGRRAPLGGRPASCSVVLTLAEICADDTSLSGGALEAARLGQTVSLPLLWGLSAWARVKRRIVGRPLRTNALLFDGLSPRCRSIREGAASWRALEYIYGHQFGRPGLRARLEDLWLRTRNAQAVRNRLRLCRSLVRSSCPRRGTVRLLSLAAGSAPAVLDVAGELALDERLGGLWLLDIDAAGLDLARQRATTSGFADRLTTVVGDVCRFERLVGGLRPDVIEMVGFLDYLRDGAAVRLLRALLRQLTEGGTLITSHIHPSPEAGFLRNVVDWGLSPPMLYRTRGELIALLVAAGARELHAVTEPQRIHTVVTARL